MLKPWAIGGLIFITLAIGAMFFAAGGQFADWRVRNTTPTEERSFAEVAIRQANLTDRFTSPSDPAHQMVERVGRRLVAAIPQGTRYQYRFHVVDEASVNAFALPGGDVVVHRGLLQLLDRSEQLAAVLAHEIQHVELQHGLRGYFHAQSAATILGWTFGLTSPDGTELAVYLKQAKYGRALETEADLRGAELLARANIDRIHMVDLLRKLAALPGSHAPVWMSDHPDPLARAKRVESAQ